VDWLTGNSGRDWRFANLDNGVLANSRTLAMTRTMTACD